jgi:hypothetical protein
LQIIASHRSHHPEMDPQLSLTNDDCILKTCQAWAEKLKQAGKQYSKVTFTPTALLICTHADITNRTDGRRGCAKLCSNVNSILLYVASYCEILQPIPR